jgi:UDP-N-acetylmuramate--alanine ligase
MIPVRSYPKLHFTGIGGAGMAPLAAWHAARGFSVTGTDRQESSNLDWLRSLGIDARVGHDPALATSANLVVRTSAVGEDHPEVAAAIAAGVLVVRRAEALGEATRSSRSLCIAGTHGKTTTTLMLGRILRAAGLVPCVLPGGVPTNSDDVLDPGAPGPLVVETDEFDRTFLRLFPDVALVTNLEEDHLDCYRDLSDLKDAFGQFLSRLPFHGRVLLCADDNGSMSLRASCAVRVLTYGFSEGADFLGRELADSSFDVLRDGKALANIRLGVPGRHNRQNALAALAMSSLEGVDPATAARALEGFRGARRRLDLVGSVRGNPVYDDYAHHPTEIEATLQAVRESSPGRRIGIVFQPHLYSRTAHFANGFAKALSLADFALVAPVYPARETPEQGLSSDAIVSRAPSGAAIESVSGRDEAVSRLRGIAASGAWSILFVGAGDVGSWSADLVEEVAP